MRDLLLAFVNVLSFAILGRVVFSWLLMAGMRNNFIFRLDYALGIITEPIMRPLRRVIPMMGTIDITPIVAFLLLRLVSVAIVAV